MASNIITMESFVFNSSSAHIDWPSWRARFENFLLISDVNMEEAGGKAKALAFLLHFGGAKITHVYFFASGTLAEEAVTVILCVALGRMDSGSKIFISLLNSKLWTMPLLLCNETLCPSTAT